MGRTKRAWWSLPNVWRRAGGTSVVLAVSALVAPASQAEEGRVARVVARARSEVKAHVGYDRAYVARGRGSPDASRGACTDLVVRALAAGGLDVQTRLENDMLASPAAYGPHARDGRIDHRRAPNLLVYFARHARRLPNDPHTSASTFRPGDVVVWTYGACPECKADHVGIVSDTMGTRGMPLVLHNAGPHATEEDAIDAWPVLGHFRPIDER